MITFPTSFQNANGDEGSAIGHIFCDRVIDNTYLEVAQAEDYVLFRIVHESADQRYGFEQFRKMREFRVTVTAMPAVTDLIRGGVDDGEEYPSVNLWDEYGEGDIGFALTEEGITVGCKLGSTKLLKVRLDNDSTLTFCELLEAFYQDYQDYLERRAFMTETVRNWHKILDRLEGRYPSDVIEEAIRNAYTVSLDDEVTVELYDQADCERMTDLLMIDYDWTVAYWRRALLGLREDRQEVLLNKIADELGFDADHLEEDPRGCTSRTRLSMSLHPNDDAQLQHAVLRFTSAYQTVDN